MTYLLTAWQFLKGLPWQVWAILGLLIAAWIYGNVQYSAGRESVLVELRKAEAEAKLESERARQQADEGAAERAREFEHEQETLEEVIKDAEANGSNPIDALFG